MKIKIIKDEIDYTGKQLSPLWIYKKFDMMGDAAVAFIGKCDVKLPELVDQEDVLSNSPIYSEKMINIIIEHFNINLIEGVFRQRLLVTIVKELIENLNTNINIKRKGDDIFIDGKKATVSIATKSHTSVLIHFGINIVSKNAIIDVASLSNNTNITNYEEFALKVLKLYNEEIDDIILATTKVRGV